MVVELSQVFSFLHLVHLCLVFHITNKHWLQNCLSLEQSFNIIRKFLIFYVLLDLSICEKELSDFKLMLARKTLCNSFIMQSISIYKHLYRIAYSIGVLFAILAYSFHMIRPRYIIR